MNVVCAVITNEEGKIFAAKRPAEKHYGGKWEFPGGKIEDAESPMEALQRELAEELTFVPKLICPLEVVTYPRENTSPLQLLPFLAKFEGEEMHSNEHSESGWFSPEELPTLDWAPPDVAIVKNYLNLSLPETYLHRFGGIARLYGLPALRKFARSHVMVVGIGGVGSWVAEALLRSGIQNISLVDMDDVCVTNTNRQLPATHATVGHPKVEVMKKRLLDIHPEAIIHARSEFFTSSTAADLLAEAPDLVIDAIDRMTNKALLLAECTKRLIPVVTVGGAGGRRDPTQIEVADLAHAGRDNLLRMVRRKLRRSHGFPKGDGHVFGIPAVFSREPQVFPAPDGTVCSTPTEDSPLRLDCSSGFGSASFVTGSFAFAAVSAALHRIHG